MLCRFFGDFLARTRTNMDPNEWVILAYDGVPAHRDLRAHSFPIRTQIMLPLDIVATIKTDISCPEIQRCMDNRNEAKALKISLWGTQQLLEALRRNIDSVTAAKCAKMLDVSIESLLRDITD